MSHDHTRERAFLRLAAAAGKDFSFRDDRSRCLLRGPFFHIEDASLPGELAGPGIQRVHLIVRARADDTVPVDCNAPVDTRRDGQTLSNVLRPRSLVFPY